MKLGILMARFWRTLIRPSKGAPEAAVKEQVPELGDGSEELPPVQGNQQPGAESLHSEEQQKTGKRKSLVKRSDRRIKEEKSAKIEKRIESPIVIVRSELNLEQNAVFTVTTYRGESREIVVRKYGPASGVLERKAIVGRTIDGKETGVLTTQHFKVYLALLQLWEEAGRPDDTPVQFTIIEILNLLGMTDAGSNYEMTKRHLINLRQIPITFIDSFFASQERIYKSLRPFTIINHLQIYERKHPEEETESKGCGEFQFDKYILENMINNYTHPLKLSVVRKFKKHKDLSILLYAYIDRNIASRSEYEIRLEKLFEHLDLSQNYVKYPSHRKAKIEPVLEQLRGKELSTGVLSYARILKTKDGRDYKLVCRKKPFSKRLKEQEAPSQAELTLPTKTGSEPPETESGPSSELLLLLMEKGLTEKQAAKLVSEKSPEIISTQLDYLPFRLEEYKAQRREVNATAILYDSITGNWNTPKSYLQAEKEKEREVRRLEQERIARLEQEERDKEEQERARIEAYKAALSSGERAKLRERALEEIRGMGGMKEEFIGDILIEFKENEILRSEREKDEN